MELEKWHIQKYLDIAQNLALEDFRPSFFLILSSYSIIPDLYDDRIKKKNEGLKSSNARFCAMSKYFCMCHFSSSIDLNF